MARIRRIDAFLAFVAFVESISVRFATHYIRANGFSNPRGLREKKKFRFVLQIHFFQCWEKLETFNGQ